MSLVKLIGRQGRRCKLKKKKTFLGRPREEDDIWRHMGCKMCVVYKENSLG